MDNITSTTGLQVSFITCMIVSQKLSNRSIIKVPNILNDTSNATDRVFAIISKLLKILK